MTTKNTIISNTTAAHMLGSISGEFALIPNPDYVYPGYEVVPLAPKLTAAPAPLVAVVMDMDGTTTTTEELCIHSLESMVRKITGRPSANEWKGLDEALDYPNIIGNSTTKHVEYLISKYAPMIDDEHLRRSYMSSALWTIAYGQDEQRVAEMKNTLANLGCASMLADDRLRELTAPERHLGEGTDALLDYFLGRYGADFRADTLTARVRAGIDIYYQIYHAILMEMRAGKAEELAERFLGSADRHLIEPMPGIGIALSLMKGWLGADAASVADDLIAELERKTKTTYDAGVRANAKHTMARLGRYFEQNPLKVSVVTSSIRYEANIIMNEVCHVIQKQIDAWNIPKAKKQSIRAKFSSYLNIYDGFVTANDSSEIRLKPHRDLYCMALHALGIPKDQFSRVAGFEDSESGTFAIRAAGIGLCIAVPFEKSKGHNLDAAAFVLPGGVPEALIAHNLFMRVPDQVD